MTKSKAHFPRVLSQDIINYVLIGEIYLITREYGSLNFTNLHGFYRMQVRTVRLKANTVIASLYKKGQQQRLCGMCNDDEHCVIVHSISSDVAG